MAIDFTEPAEPLRLRLQRIEFMVPREKSIIEFADENGQSKVDESHLMEFLLAVGTAKTIEEFKDKVEDFFIANVLGSGDKVPD